MVSRFVFLFADIVLPGFRPPARGLPSGKEHAILLPLCKHLLP